MSTLIRSLALAAALGLCSNGVAFAQDADAGKAMTPQQTRMKTCNAQAGGKTGDDRKTFMASCLSNRKTLSSSQERMKTCNAQAAGKTGADRKTFMSSCLKTTGS